MASRVPKSEPESESELEPEPDEDDEDSGSKSMSFYAASLYSSLKSSLSLFWRFS